MMWKIGIRVVMGGMSVARLDVELGKEQASIYVDVHNWWRERGKESDKQMIYTCA